MIRTFTIVLGVLVCLQTVPVRAAGVSGCDALMPAPKAGAAAVKRAALLKAACAGLDCVKKCPNPQSDKYSITEVYAGSFRCPGRHEALVNLFPCDEGASALASQFGKAALLQETRNGWKRIASADGLFLSRSACRLVHFGRRDGLLCLPAFMGQGFSGVSICALTDGRGKLRFDCPARAMETQPSCDNHRASRATILDTRVHSGTHGYVTVRVDIGVATAATKSSDPAACESAQQAVLKAKANRYRLTFILDSRGLRLSATSKRWLKFHPTDAISTD